MLRTKICHDRRRRLLLHKQVSDCNCYSLTRREVRQKIKKEFAIRSTG